MSSEVGILELTSLHVWVTVDKKRSEKAVRFARVSISANGNKTRQILQDDKWTEVSEEEFYGKVESTRDMLIGKLEKELLSQVKEKKTPKQ